MKGQKAYPPGFQQAMQDVSNGCCEICGRPGVTIHHIWGRGMMGKTINRLWNTVALCFLDHKPGTGDYGYKVALWGSHMRNLLNYCTQWDKKPNKEWTRLMNGQREKADLENAFSQMKEEGVNKEG